jgi:hypothetical protein
MANLVRVIDGELKLKDASDEQLTTDNAVSQTPIQRADIKRWLVFV